MKTLEKMHDICRPGLLVTQLFPEAIKDSRVGSAVVEFAAASAFYTAVEIAEVYDGRDRAKIARNVSRTEMKVTYWLSKPQQDSGLSISSLDEKERRAAVNIVIDLLPLAAECKADHVAIQSGPDVPSDLRQVATEQLRKSVCEIHRPMVKYGSMRLLFEPVDRDAYTKYLIGPTREAMNFVAETREVAPRLDLGLDTAHIRLQKEEPLEALAAAAGITTQLHLANCVTDPAEPGFGDHHLPPGRPGFLSEEYIETLLQKGIEIGLFGLAKPILSVEIVGPGGQESWHLEQVQREMMIHIWRRVLENRS